MSLDVVKQAGFVESAHIGDVVLDTPIYSKWQHSPVSTISHHNANCCKIAREWLHAMDYSQLNAASKLSGPRWIPQRYTWGPTKWPIYWCEVVDQKTLDCGAQSALAVECFAMRGVASYQVQLAQKFSNETTRQWHERWTADDTSVFWIDANHIYHECCAIVIANDEIKIWDGSSGTWVNPRQSDGYGSVCALRLFDPAHNFSTFRWGDHTIKSNKWELIKTAG